MPAPDRTAPDRQDRPWRLAYLVSHPIQYQAPLLRAIAGEPDIDLTVFFCSDWSLSAHRDEGFGREIAWDVPLIDGYRHEFLPRRADPGAPGPWRPLNYGLLPRLRRGRFDALWVHGFARLYNLIAMARAHAAGLVVLNRDEAWAHSAPRGPAKAAVKRLFFAALKRVCDGFLVIGSANRAYYASLGVDDRTMFTVPYAVDNASFRSRAEQAGATRNALRRELGIAPDRPVVLFASKFTDRKRPDDLLEAFARIAGRPETRAPCLVFVGDGERRAVLEARTAALGLGESVRFAGFRNQSELPRFYDLCDVFVLPSFNEPWGLVVNEAMNADCAIVASDQVGAAHDLVRDGENGLLFPAGDVEALSDRLARILADPERCRAMGLRSGKIIAGWGFAEDIAGLRAALDHFVPREHR